MSLTTAEINWLIVIQHFLKIEKVWNERHSNFKELIPAQMFLRLDLFLKVLRCALDSEKPRDASFRTKFCSQMDGFAFIMAYAENETGKSFWDIADRK